MIKFTFQLSSSSINWCILVALGFIWGGSFLGVEISLTGFGPITIAASRVSMAAIVLLGYTYLFGDGLPKFTTSKEKRIWLHCFGMAIFTNAIPFSLLSWGQQLVTSGFAGISMAVVPLFVLPLSHFLVPGEYMSKLKVIGFVFGFSGVVLLVGGERVFYGQASTPNILAAQIACVIASCCYAIGTIITRLCPPVSAVSYAACGLTIGALVLLPLALLVEGLPQTANLFAVSSLLYLALFPTAIATILLTVLVRRAGPPFLSMVNYQVPIWAVLIGFIILGEALPNHFVIALMIILAGLFISQWRKNLRT